MLSRAKFVRALVCFNLSKGFSVFLSVSICVHPWFLDRQVPLGRMKIIEGLVLLCTNLQKRSADELKPRMNTDVMLEWWRRYWRNKIFWISPAVLNGRKS